jgi:CRISPR/Cas system CMR-associated protein Cmr5 small subunit
MKNLDQIRAHNALLHKDNIANSQGGGDAISGFPMLVLTDGLLAALAFACEWKNPQAGTRKHPGEYTVATAITEHLCDSRNPICNATDADDLIGVLARENSDALLRRSTAEALAFLNYLKRFVA